MKSYTFGSAIAAATLSFALPVAAHAQASLDAANEQSFSLASATHDAAETTAGNRAYEASYAENADTSRYTVDTGQFAAPNTVATARNAALLRARALRWELAYLGLGVIDAAQTINCLNDGICVEGNPIMGKNPTPAKLLLGRLALGSIHFAVFNAINKRNPKTAMRVAQISCAVQGATVLFNARILLD